MENQESERTCVNNIKALLLWCKVFGVLPCTIRNGKLERDNGWGRAICVIWLLINCFRIVNEQLLSCNENPFIIIMQISHTVMMLTEYIISTFKQDRIITIFNSIQKYDEKIHCSGLKKKENFSYFWLYLVAILVNALYFFGSISKSLLMTQNISYSTLVSPLLDIIVQLSYLHSNVKYLLIVYLLYKRYEFINKELIPILFRSNAIGRRKSITIKNIQELYITLREAVEILNRNYLVILPSGFTFTLYYIIAHAYEQIQQPAMKFSLYNMLLLLIAMFCTCRLGYLISVEADNVSKNLIRGNITLVGNLITTDHIETLIFLLHNKVVIKLGDCYDINLELFNSIIAFLTTYFFVMGHVD